jgi:hypothetical protein
MKILSTIVAAAVTIVTATALLPARAGQTLRVNAGENLQAALDRAQPGDTVLLAPGATFVGNFVLPRKAGSEYITIRTDVAAGAVLQERIGPDDSGTLARLRSGNVGPALETAPGAHHWRIEDLEFLANAGGIGEIIRLGRGSQHAGEVPHDLVLQRLLIRGDPANGQKRGIALNSASTVVRGSYIAGIGVPGQDSQAVCGWNGPGPFLIENNYLEAAAENVMFGGADPSIPGLVPTDITIRGNHFNKPLEWREQERWSVKNLFELKNARRVLVENNLFERSWRHAQTGNAILFTVRNDGGRAPWSVVEDVTFQYNVVRHAGGGFSILGEDNIHPSGRTRRLRIRHNLLYDIDGARWGGSGRFVLIGAAPQDVIIDHNTVLQSGAAVYAYGLEKDPRAVIQRFVYTNNITMHGDYGIMGESGGGMGRRSIARYFPGGLIERNVLAGGNGGAYDGENYFPSIDDLMSQFSDPENHDYRLREDSRFLRLATDGGSLGADIGSVLARIARVVEEDRPRGPRPPRRK